jgi:hypothetical protein
MMVYNTPELLGFGAMFIVLRSRNSVQALRIVLSKGLNCVGIFLLT